MHRLGAIELSSTPVKPTPEHTKPPWRPRFVSAACWTFAVATNPKRYVEFETLRGRLGIYIKFGPPWPDVTDTALTQHLDDWLEPEIEQLARGTHRDRLDLTAALRRLLPWPEASGLDELAPERLQVPSGSHIRIDWPAPEEHSEDDVAPPVLAVKLQECFGWTTSPTVANGRVPVVLHLLSPARRPLAITTDLANFWESVYPQVRAENRGRYVKHPWPEDPLAAVATAKTNRALRNQHD